MTQSTDKIKLMEQRLSRTLCAPLGIEFVKIEHDEVSATMPVCDATRQPLGLLHGGASVALAETVASVGGWINAAENESVVGIEINANHLSSLSEGSVTGTATPLHVGKSTQVWEIEITDNTSGKLVCISRCTLAVIKQKTDE